MQRKGDTGVLSFPLAIDAAANRARAGRVEKVTFSCYVPHYTTNVFEQRLMLVPFATRAATYISYIGGSPFTKDVTIETFWNFELDVQSGFDVPFYVRFGFLQRGHLNQQYHKKDTF